LVSSSRDRLQGPEKFLATEEDLHELLDSIIDHLNLLRRKAEEIEREEGMAGVANGLCQTINSFDATALLLTVRTQLIWFGR
jgi:hypothetical protein